jgi:hypothetical protein
MLDHPTATLPTTSSASAVFNPINLFNVLDSVDPQTPDANNDAVETTVIETINLLNAPPTIATLQATSNTSSVLHGRAVQSLNRGLRTSSLNWTDHFELRGTEDRGI